jgi:hypothetical protein
VKREEKRVEPSPIRKQVAYIKMEEPQKTEGRRKPAVMDAWTQTEKSATLEYKQKMR